MVRVSSSVYSRSHLRTAQALVQLWLVGETPQGWRGAERKSSKESMTFGISRNRMKRFFSSANQSDWIWLPPSLKDWAVAASAHTSRVPAVPSSVIPYAPYELVLEKGRDFGNGYPWITHRAKSVGSLNRQSIICYFLCEESIFYTRGYFSVAYWVETREHSSPFDWQMERMDPV